MNVVHPHPSFKMIVETSIEKYRAKSFSTKEPETIEWIKSFDHNDIFWDVGANIGIYSLFVAGIFPALRIWAFEPGFKNFARLMQNIKLNGFINIFPVFMALSNHTEMGAFYLPRSDYGESGGQLDDFIDETGKQFEPIDQYNILSFRPDDLTSYLPVPNHIKIDVDGQETKILIGMSAMLADPMVKSLLVEFNHDLSTKTKWIMWFEKYGFATDNEFNRIENHSSIRRKKEGIKAENIIFVRK